MRVADARTLWKVPSFEAVKKRFFFRSVPAPCVYEAISFTRYSCFAVHNVPLRDWRGVKLTFGRSTQAGASSWCFFFRILVVFSIPRYLFTFIFSFSFFRFFSIPILKNSKRQATFHDATSNRVDRVGRHVDQQSPTSQASDTSRYQKQELTLTKTVSDLWSSDPFNFLLFLWRSDARSLRPTTSCIKIVKQTKISALWAAEMPNLKFTLYEKKTFAHLGAYFRPGAWPQRAGMIFLSASLNHVGFQASHIKKFPSRWRSKCPI